MDNEARQTCSCYPRIVIYSQDGLGLGHMQRTTSIASQFLKVCPEACILTLADSRLGQFFETKPNHDYLKLPSILKAGPGDWRAVNLPLPFADVHAMRKELIRSAVLTFQPHIFLVDHMPHGAMGELVPTLEALKAASADTRVVLGLRDILDAPEVVQHRWRVEGAYDAIERYYDLVLVYGCREIFNLAEQYSFSAALASRLRYCGYLCTSVGALHALQTRAQALSGAKEGAKLIVVTGGGGADAYPVMRALLEAFPAIRARQPATLALITGPFMPPDLWQDLRMRARGLPVHIRISVSDMPDYIEAADLVVAMAGYNTTMEILRGGRRAILIPRVGPSAEQRLRTKLFAAQGWVDTMDPNDLQARPLAELVLKNLERGPKINAPTEPDLQGLNVAVNHLLTLAPPALPERSILARDQSWQRQSVPALSQA